MPHSNIFDSGNIYFIDLEEDSRDKVSTLKILFESVIYFKYDFWDIISYRKFCKKSGK